MAQMKTFNGYEIVDAQARNDIKELQEKEVDLSDYYTKAQTDSAIGEAVGGIEIPEVDLSGKADLVHQHSMADITDYVAPSLEGYATETYVNEQVSAVEVNYTVIEDRLNRNYYEYAKKSDIDTAIANIPPEYAVIDLCNCTKVSDTFWQLTDNTKNILQRLFNGERFFVVLQTAASLLQVPSNISVTAERVQIKLDTSHMYSGGTVLLTGLEQEVYTFSDANGKLQVTTSKINITDYSELSKDIEALEERVAAIENIATAEGGSY